MYMLNNIGSKSHPCLKPLLVEICSEIFMSAYFMYIVCFCEDILLLVLGCCFVLSTVSHDLKYHNLCGVEMWLD
jgi:hypothetical protein